MLLGMSFAWYINNTTNDTVEQFETVFGHEIGKLPDRVISSKRVRQYLTIDTDEKENIFQKTFLEYFRAKILQAEYTH
jgi:hypothetical protein